MKFIKITILILLIFIVSFMSIGLINPSFTYESEVKIEASPQESWAIFENPFYMKEWIPGFQSITPIKMVAGQVGSEFELVMEDQGKIMKMTEVITAYEKESLFAMTLSGEVLKSDVTITFSSENGQTLIHEKSVVEGNNILWKSLLYLMKDSFEDTSKKQYLKLKEIIESKQAE